MGEFIIKIKALHTVKLCCSSSSSSCNKRALKIPDWQMRRTNKKTSQDALRGANLDFIVKICGSIKFEA